MHHGPGGSDTPQHGNSDSQANKACTGLGVHWPLVDWPEAVKYSALFHVPPYYKGSPNGKRQRLG